MFVMFMPNSDQLTTAHYFMIEKCVSVQKSPTKNVMMQVNIHMKKCE